MRTKLMLFMVVVMVCGSVALALDPMGPPKAGLQKGQFSFGIDYSYSDMTIGRIPGNTWTDSTKKVAEIDEMHKVYANIGYGLSENVEGFLRIGAGSPEVDRLGGSTAWESDGGHWDAILGGGVKATLWENEQVAWGILAQYSWGELACDQKEIGGTDRQEIELDLTELQLAFGPTVSVCDWLSVYVGPFLHIIDGSYMDNRDGDVATKSIEEESMFGGYLGAQIKVANNTNLNIEYMATPDADAFAASLIWKF
ncbi:MAG: outer membrane beta-barrel protein [Planctomycetota bacterium]|nr:outer membrane beta-barrel protein [Planctomycetota bacterium]